MTEEFLTEFNASELQYLTAGVNAIDVDETDGEALHLRVFDGGRQWTMESQEGQLVVDVDDPTSSGDGRQYAISERVRRFADAFDDQRLSLTIVDGTTALVTAGTASAAIDLVPHVADDVAPWRVEPVAQAQVSMREFLMLLWSARCMPSGIGETGYPMPPMWMGLGDGRLSLHVDWTDFLPSRATYRITVADVHGEATVAIPHVAIENFLRTTPLADGSGEEHSLRIVVGVADVHGEEHDVVGLVGPGWRLVVFAVHPMADRWQARIEEAFIDSGVTVQERSRDEWFVRAGHGDVRVKVHAGHPDVVRVSAPLLTHTLESIELLRELGQLNAASSGLRYWFDHGVVRVVADVRCTTLSSLGAAVRDVGEAAHLYSPMLAAFATS